VRTGDVLSQEASGSRLEPEIESKIMMIEPLATPFTAMLEKIGSESCGQPEFTTQFEFPFPEFSPLTANATAVATTVTVANAEWMIPKMTFLNTRTNEQVYVTAISGQTLTVTRGVGSTAQAMLAGDKLLFLAIAQPENGEMVQPRWRGTEEHTGFCQMMEESIMLTELMMVRKWRGTSELDRNTAQKIRNFQTQKERMFLLGQQNKSRTDGFALYHTGGVRQCASMYNNIDLGHYMTYKSIRRALDAISERGGVIDPVLICSSALKNELSGMPEFTKTMRTTQAEDTLGYRLNKIEFGAGIGTLVGSGVLNHTGLNDEMLVVDMSVFKKKTFIPLKSKPVDQVGAHREAQQMYEMSGLSCSSAFVLGRIHNIGYIGTR